MVTSVPRDMATPTSAWVSAGASFTPSPDHEHPRARRPAAPPPAPASPPGVTSAIATAMPEPGAPPPRWCAGCRRERRLTREAERRRAPPAPPAPPARTASATTSSAAARPPRARKATVSPRSSRSAAACAAVRRRSPPPPRPGRPGCPPAPARPPPAPPRRAPARRGSPSTSGSAAAGQRPRRLDDGPSQAVLGAPLHRRRQPQRAVRARRPPERQHLPQLRAPPRHRAGLVEEHLVGAGRPARSTSPPFTRSPRAGGHARWPAAPPAAWPGRARTGRR